MDRGIYLNPEFEKMYTHGSLAWERIPENTVKIKELIEKNQKSSYFKDQKRMVKIKSTKCVK